MAVICSGQMRWLLLNIAVLSRISAASGTCGGDFTLNEGTISSPNFPNIYDANSRCIYKITMPAGNRVLLVFQDLQLESHGTCTYDVVKIYDGDSTSGATLGTFCGVQLPPPIISSQNMITIDFKSDGSNQFKGFSAAFRKVTCGSISASATGTISSPNFPHQYGPNEKCIYVISVPTGSVALLTFITLELETEDNCEHDYIKVYDGSNLNSPSIGTFCGFIRPAPVLSSSNNMIIEFHSNSRNQGKGFELRYETVTCTGTFVSETGTISSPNFPNQYGPNEECIYLISVPKGSVALLTFITLELETEDSCEHDYIKVYDGSNLNSPTLGTFCGFTRPAPILSSSNKMVIQFRSNNRNHNKGFQVRYETVSCVKHYVSDEGTISSSNYPDLYNANERCYFRFAVPEGYGLVLSFQDFELESRGNCSHDNITIYEGTDIRNPSFGYFCGSTIPRPILFPGNKGTIEFQSDSSDQYRGFSAKFRKVKCGGNFFSNNGTISSPNFPNKYSPNKRCIYNITVPHRNVVLLNFNVFELETQEQCVYDFVKIYDGNANIGTFCGTTIPDPIVSSGTSVTIDFYSDDSEEYKGFSAEFKAEILCDDSTCKNGGTCITGGLNGISRCICRHGYRGLQCEEKILCSDDTCRHGGICTQDGREGTIRCSCQHGYHGRTCERSILCDSDTCKNGGTCTVDGTGETSCTCRHGYRGLRCTEKIVCDGAICKNGGICRQDDLNGIFQCSCRPGYRGLRCEEKTVCDGTSCKNGGTCTQDGLDGIFRCTCMPGYRALRCEERIMCRDNPCKNGGSCTQDGTEGVFKCMCKYGYTGLRCEESNANLPFQGSIDLRDSEKGDKGGNSFAMFYVGLGAAVMGTITCILAVIIIAITKKKNAPVINRHTIEKDDDFLPHNKNENTYELI